MQLRSALSGALPFPCLLAARDGSQCFALLKQTPSGIAVFDPITLKSEVHDFDFMEAAGNDHDVLLLKPGHSDRDGWHDHMLRRARCVLGHVAFASMLVNIFALDAPLVALVVFNKVIPHEAFSTLNIVATGAIIMYVFEALVRSARGYIVVQTGARIDAHVGCEVTAHLLRLPLRYFEGASSGKLVEQIRQLDTIRAFLTGDTPILLVDLAFSLILFVALLLIDWRIGFLILSAAPLFAAGSFLFDKTQNRLGQKLFTANVSKTTSLNEILRNIVTIKSLGLESDMEARHAEHLAKSGWASFKVQALAGHLISANGLLLMALNLGVLYAGARLVIDGQMSMGELIAANMLAIRALSPIRHVATAWHRLREAQQAFERLDILLGETSEAALCNSPAVLRSEASVTLQDVCFVHAPDRPPALKDVSLTLAPGSITALIGASGSGKTTIGKLIAGLCGPSSGRILIGEHDVRHFSPITLRRQLGYVPQENQLFAGTNLENILLGAPSSVLASAARAAKFVGAHEFIVNLPQGYNTYLGEGGVGLSAGQRQLVCIARAFAREPRLVILDEATSALDPALEEKLVQNLRAAAKTAGVTVLLITHRPGPLRLCDRVVVLDKGMVSRQGPPDDVLRHKLARPVVAANTEKLSA